jgi:hypothetical protein
MQPPSGGHKQIFAVQHLRCNTNWLNYEHQQGTPK